MNGKKIDSCRGKPYINSGIAEKEKLTVKDAAVKINVSYLHLLGVSQWASSDVIFNTQETCQFQNWYNQE